MPKSALGRFPFVRTDQRPAHSHRNESFTFNKKLTIQIGQILNIMRKGDGFSAKPLGKKTYFIANMSGLAMVRPASSDFNFGKRPKMGSIIGHRIDYNTVGALRGQ